MAGKKLRGVKRDWGDGRTQSGDFGCALLFWCVRDWNHMFLMYMTKRHSGVDNYYLSGFYICGSICTWKCERKIFLWTKNPITSKIYWQPTNTCQVFRLCYSHVFFFFFLTCKSILKNLMPGYINERSVIFSLVDVSTASTSCIVCYIVYLPSWESQLLHWQMSPLPIHSILYTRGCVAW